MLEQQPNHRQVALEGRAGQRSVALVVAQLWVAAMLEQHPRGVQVTVIAGQHQQAVAVAVADIGRQAPREQIAETLRIAVAGPVEDLLGEGQGSIVQFGLVGSVHLGSSAAVGGNVSGRHCAKRFSGWRAQLVYVVHSPAQLPVEPGWRSERAQERHQVSFLVLAQAALQHQVEELHGIVQRQQAPVVQIGRRILDAA